MMFIRRDKKAVNVSHVEKLEDRRLMSVTYGANLILNPGAEQYSGNANGFNIITPTHWTTNGEPTMIQYGNDYANKADVHKPNNGGNAFFAGGPDDSSTDFFQTIDLSSIAGTIEAGQVSFALSAAIGGRGTDNDTATVSINFEDASKNFISQVNTADVTRSDRKDRSKFIRRTKGGTVPVNAEFAQIQIHFQRFDGKYNDGYADNLSLILATNLPSTAGITPSLAKSTLKTQVVTGSKTTGNLLLNLTNTSTSVNSGVDVISLFASTTGAVDSNSILIGRLKRSITLLPGRSTQLNFSVRALVLPARTFSIFAQTSDYLPTVVTSPLGVNVTVGSPFVSLSATVGPVAPASTTHDQPINFALTLNNSGNIDSTGLATITIGLTRDGTTVAVPLATLQKRLAIKSNAPSIVLPMKVKIPSSPPGGAFQLLVSFVQENYSVIAVGVTSLTIVT